MDTPPKQPYHTTDSNLQTSHAYAQKLQAKHPTASLPSHVWKYEAQVWEPSDNRFHIVICTMYLFTNKQTNMAVFVNSSSIKIGQFTVKLLKRAEAGTESLGSTHHYFCHIYNWSHLYISIVHHLLVGAITHPCITNLLASAICICCHCDNTIKHTLRDQFPRVKNIQGVS